MAKLTDVDFLGQKGNILDVSSWLKIILGGVMVLIGFAASQNIVNKIGSSIPYVDTKIDPVVNMPSNAPKAQGRMYL